MDDRHSYDATIAAPHMFHYRGSFVSSYSDSVSSEPAAASASPPGTVESHQSDFLGSDSSPYYSIPPRVTSNVGLRHLLRVVDGVLDSPLESRYAQFAQTQRLMQREITKAANKRRYYDGRQIQTHHTRGDNNTTRSSQPSHRVDTAVDDPSRSTASSASRPHSSRLSSSSSTSRFSRRPLGRPPSANPSVSRSPISPHRVRSPASVSRWSAYNNAAVTVNVNLPNRGGQLAHTNQTEKEAKRDRPGSAIPTRTPKNAQANTVVRRPQTARSATRQAAAQPKDYGANPPRENSTSHVRPTASLPSSSSSSNLTPRSTPSIVIPSALSGHPSSAAADRPHHPHAALPRLRPADQAQRPPTSTTPDNNNDATSEEEQTKQRNVWQQQQQQQQQQEQPLPPPLMSRMDSPLRRVSSPPLSGRQVGVAPPGGRLVSTLSLTRAALAADSSSASAHPTSRHSSRPASPTGGASSRSRPSTARTNRSQHTSRPPSASPSRWSCIDASGLNSSRSGQVTTRSNLTSRQWTNTSPDTDERDEQTARTNNDSDTDAQSLTARSAVGVIHSAADPAVIDLHRCAKSGDLEGAMRLLWRRSLLLHRLPVDSDSGVSLASAGCSSDPRDTRDRNGSTPLFHAAWEGDDRMARLLLDQTDIPPTIRNVRGNSALDMAVETSKAQLVHRLLAHGAKLSHASIHAAEEARRLTAITDRATYQVDTAIIQSLRRRLDDTPHKALKLAQLVKSNSLARTKDAFHSNPGSSRKWIRQFMERGLTLLGWACWLGHGEMAQLLIQHGADIHSLCFVACDGSLLEPDSSDDASNVAESNPLDTNEDQPNHRARDTDAFGIAVDQGYYDIATMLLGYGASGRFARHLLPADASPRDATIPIGARDVATIRERLSMLQRMHDASVSMRHHLVSLSDSQHDDPLTVESHLDSLCRDAPSEMASAVIEFPDRFGRTAIHVCISLQLAHSLDFLLGRIGACEVPPESDADEHTLLSTRDSLRHKIPLELALETNNLLIIMQLLRVTRPSMILVMRALDRTLYPHSSLSDENGLAALQYTFERLRARQRILRARRARQADIEREACRMRGEKFIEPPIEPDVLTAEELIDMLNGTNIDARLAKRIMQMLLPGLNGDRAERGLDGLPSLDALLAQLHAISLANGESLSADGSSGYGRTDSGLTARGAADKKAREQSSRKNPLYDQSYLSALLARQRAHADREHALWSANMSAWRHSQSVTHAQLDIAEIRRMQDSTLTPMRRAKLEEIYRSMQDAGEDEVEFPPSSEEVDEERKRQLKLIAHDMLSLDAQLHRSGSVSHPPAVPVSTVVDWATLSQSPMKMRQMQLSQTPASASADAPNGQNSTEPNQLHTDDHATTNTNTNTTKPHHSSKTPFKMKEVVEFNPRILTALRSFALARPPSHPAAPTDSSSSSHPPRSIASVAPASTRVSSGAGAGGGVGAASSSSESPASGPITRYAKSSLEVWMSCWQEQAWDEGIHSIDVFLHEAERRRDESIKQRDWLPLAFLWPNRWSQDEALRASHARYARLSRLVDYRRAVASAVTESTSAGAGPNARRRLARAQRQLAEATEENEEVEMEYRYRSDEEQQTTHTEQMGTLQPILATNFQDTDNAHGQQRESVTGAPNGLAPTPLHARDLRSSPVRLGVGVDFASRFALPGSGVVELALAALADSQSEEATKPTLNDTHMRMHTQPVSGTPSHLQPQPPPPFEPSNIIEPRIIRIAQAAEKIEQIKRNTPR